MFGKWLFALVAPLALAVTFSACNDRACSRASQASRRGRLSRRGRAGRLDPRCRVSGNPAGVNNGTLVGGGVGRRRRDRRCRDRRHAGSAVLGGVLGAVGGAIAGTAIDRNSPTRGIEVTVRRTTARQVTIAQRDDGDIQMGDRVIIVYDNNGVARAVRDTGRRRD